MRSNIIAFTLVFVCACYGSPVPQSSNVADTVSIAISMPKDANPRAWPAFQYQLVKDVEHQRNAFASGTAVAQGRQGAVAIQHSLAIADVPDSAFAKSKAIASSQ